MKITDLKIHVLKSQLTEPFAFSQGWVKQRSATLLEILTDEGITGWWDLEKFSECPACFPARRARLREMNLRQTVPARVACPACSRGGIE